MNSAPTTTPNSTCAEQQDGGQPKPPDKDVHDTDFLGRGADHLDDHRSDRARGNLHHSLICTTAAGAVVTDPRARAAGPTGYVPVPPS